MVQKLYKRPRAKSSVPRQIKQPPLPFSLAERLSMLAGGPLTRFHVEARLMVCRCVPTTPDGVMRSDVEIPCAHSKPWPSQGNPTPTSNTGVKDSSRNR